MKDYKNVKYNAHGESLIAFCFDRGAMWTKAAGLEAVPDLNTVA